MCEFPGPGITHSECFKPTMTLETYRERKGHLLIADDDKPFRLRLARAMEKRGFIVSTAASVDQSIVIARSEKITHAVLDLRLADGSGLDIVSTLRITHPDIRVVMLTGYGNIATAVAAVKAGAIDYLAKPADADIIESSLLTLSNNAPSPPDQPMSADRVRWEHIQRIYELCDRNVSETARRLKLHRRTLQRILSKKSPQ